MICKHCGRTLPDGALLCVNCGEPVTAPGLAVPPPPLPGESAEPSFVPAPGAAPAPAPPDRVRIPEPANPSRASGKISVAAVAGLVLCLSCFVLSFFRAFGMVAGGAGLVALPINILVLAGGVRRRVGLAAIGVLLPLLGVAWPLISHGIGVRQTPNEAGTGTPRPVGREGLGVDRQRAAALSQTRAAINKDIRELESMAASGGHYEALSKAHEIHDAIDDLGSAGDANGLHEATDRALVKMLDRAATERCQAAIGLYHGGDVKRAMRMCEEATELYDDGLRVLSPESSSVYKQASGLLSRARAELSPERFEIKGFLKLGGGSAVMLRDKLTDQRVSAKASELIQGFRVIAVDEKEGQVILESDGVRHVLEE